MLKVGLTGGIASGKSRVLRRFAAAGFATLDLDAVGHAVLEPAGSAYADVRREFGEEILGPGGAIDRKALGRIVFADPRRREILNALTHPRIREEEARRIREAAARGARVFVTDAALLVEVGIHLRYERIVVAHCPAELQLRRLMQRDAIDEAAARSRIDAQMDAELKRRFAHVVVDTARALEDTDAAADAAARELRAAATGRSGPMVLRPDAVRAALLWGPRPAGLPPERVITEAVRDGVLDVGLLHRLAGPGDGRPWYLGSPTAPPPESLVVPAVLWSLAKGGADAPLTASVAASVARVVRPEGAAIAGASAYAVAFQESAVSRQVSAREADLRVFAAIGERWGGVPPPPGIRAAIVAAAGAHQDPGRAREAARATGGDPELAAALVGIAAGAPEVGATPATTAAVEALGRVS